MWNHIHVIKLEEFELFRFFVFHLTIENNIHDDIWYSNQLLNGIGRRTNLLVRNDGNSRDLFMEFQRPLDELSINATDNKLSISIVNTSGTYILNSFYLFINICTIIPSLLQNIPYSSYQNYEIRIEMNIIYLRWIERLFLNQVLFPNSICSIHLLPSHQLPIM